MTPSDLIGAAGAATIRQRLTSLSDSEGIARYLLDRLTGEQVAAITGALLQDSATDALLKIALPRALIGDFGLPDHVVTDERTVAIRHAECDRPALLLANTDDDQGASLGDVTLIGAKQLTEDADPWVEAAATGLHLPDNQIGAWKAALKGLNAAEDWTLHQISNYVALTRERIATESTTVPDALGWALPALHLPRDSGFFLSIREKEFEQSRRWKRQYEKLVSDRKPLLAKQRPNRQIIEADELSSQFEAVKEDIPTEVHVAIEAFIAATPGWNDAADTLSQYEWEGQSVLQLFSGIKLKKTTLPQETLTYFEYTLPDRLSPADIEYLEALKGRSLKESPRQSSTTTMMTTTVLKMEHLQPSRLRHKPHRRPVAQPCRPQPVLRPPNRLQLRQQPVSLPKPVRPFPNRKQLLERVRRQR